MKDSQSSDNDKTKSYIKFTRCTACCSNTTHIVFVEYENNKDEVDSWKRITEYIGKYGWASMEVCTKWYKLEDVIQFKELCAKLNVSDPVVMVWEKLETTCADKDIDVNKLCTYFDKVGRVGVNAFFDQTNTLCEVSEIFDFTNKHKLPKNLLSE